jgi:hypothetical protein
MLKTRRRKKSGGKCSRCAADIAMVGLTAFNLHCLLTLVLLK